MTVELQNGLLALVLTATAALHEWRLRQLRRDLADAEARIQAELRRRGRAL